MAEEDGFDEAADGVLVAWVELFDGFEVKGEVVGGSAFVAVEEEAVGGDVKRDGELAERVEGGC